MSIITKQIKDFDLNATPSGDAQLLLQTAAGTTQKTTKTALLNDVNASIIALQSQIDVLDISASNVKYDNSNTNLISETVQDAIDELYEINNTRDTRGRENCIIGQQIYDITFSETISGGEINPIVSLIVPTSASSLYVQSILDITNEGFKVLLSDAPSETGYAITWSVENHLGLINNQYLTSTGDNTLNGNFTLEGNFIINVNSVESTETNSSVFAISGAIPVDVIDHNNTFGSAQWLVLINNGLVARTSHITAVWSNSTVTMNEMRTEDVGSGTTSDLSFEADILGNKIRLIANSISSGWNVKYKRISIF